MKKQELVEAIAAKTSNDIKVVAEIIDSFIDTVCDNLQHEVEVDLYGFAKFESVVQPARMVRNPKTGEIKENPAKLVPKCRFKPTVKNKLKIEN